MAPWRTGGIAARRWVTLLGVCLAVVRSGAAAHEFGVGAVRIDHPYALASVPGSPTGAVYIKALRNAGDVPDALVAVRTAVAGWVELHHMQLEGGVMRMRAVPSVPLPARGEAVFRHGSTEGYHLMLRDLKAPIQLGDRFSVVLQFRRAGEREVVVWVQAPKEATGAGHGH
jgi:copper(I)-binding protein